MSMTVGVTATVMVMVMFEVITIVVVGLIMGLIHRGNIMVEAAVTLSREFRSATNPSLSRGEPLPVIERRGENIVNGR
jgi:hypothetical protein